MKRIPATSNARRTPLGDDGAAMILVIMWSAVLMVMVLAVSQVVLNQVRPSDKNEQVFKASAAAEAGVDIFRARLATNPDYITSMSSTIDLALKQFVDVPGMASDAEYRYKVIDSTNAQRAGTATLVSTGRSKIDGTTRSVEVTIRKRSSYDYAYLSNYETIPYNYPDAYPIKSGDENKSLAQQALTTGAGALTQAGAYYLCNERYWRNQAASQPPYLPGETAPAQPWHRNSLRCKSVPITADQRWYGDVHTNDTWYFNTTDRSGSTFSDVFTGGTVTTSCSTDNTNASCPATHRYIDVLNLTGSLPYQVNEIPDTTEYAWNPVYESVLELPATRMAKIREQAAKNQTTSPTSWGCLYTGVSRIAFYNKLIYVTSPDTRDTNPGCTGTAQRSGLQGSNTTPQTQPTAVLDVETMYANGFNGVFYVQDLPATDTGTDTTLTLNSEPKWGGGQKKAPTCTDKGSGNTTNAYPFVIPANANPSNASYGSYANKEDYLFNGGTYKGFPVEATQVNGNNTTKQDIWSSPTASKCKEGTIYMQGQYHTTDAAGNLKGLTVASEGDVVLTDDLRDENVPNTDPATRLTPNQDPVYGVPAASSKNVLGVIPRDFMYVYHPVANEGGSGWNDGYLKDLILNFASIVVEKCFSVQQYDSRPNMGDLTYVGSLAQKYRCSVKGEPNEKNGNDPQVGYTTFNIRYDDRFRSTVPPPFMMEMSGEPYSIRAIREIHSETVTYP